ncbi:hypothetical protein [Mangrovibacillus cuniculi]|uniref:Uncharacterized protein n=1 Tax=Mangrovibacillus cuniculi TaxID=2593652 RepID=A0A7S8C9Z3_9BACI|nr:hypothetical protein [Mangrovibacillus cuniculi]QPC45986.1 hypothetical protein G8O30_02955 [Mangrovibacillus cuniculi]
MLPVFLIYAGIILYFINRLTFQLCLQKEVPDEKQPKVFRTINILITILLLSTYVDIKF